MKVTGSDKPLAPPSAVTKRKLKTDNGWNVERICVALSNAFMLLLVAAALIYDVIDVFQPNLSSSVPYALDTHPLYTTTFTMLEWGYAPCDDWLRTVLMIPANSPTLEVSNSIENYQKYDSVVAVKYLLQTYNKTPLPPQDKATRSACVAYRESLGMHYAYANLGIEQIKQLQGLETLNWVDRKHNPYTGYLQFIKENPDARLVIFTLIFNHKELAASDPLSRVKVNPAKSVYVRLYKGEIKMSELQLNPKSKEEIELNHGKTLIAEAVLWGKIVRSCDGDYLDKFLDMQGLYDKANTSKVCEKVLVEGGPFLKAQLENVISRPLKPSAALNNSVLLPYTQFGTSGKLEVYTIPSGKDGKKDFLFSTRDPWTGTYATRNVAITRVMSHPNYEPIVVTGHPEGVLGGKFSDTTIEGITSLSTRETGTYVSNSTFIVDIQIFLYMFLLVVGNGWRYIPQYTKKVPSAYMLSRTSMLYVVFAQYIIWNSSNLNSAVHFVRVYYSSGWSNFRFIKNVVMSSYLLMICLYRVAFEQQVRVRCLVAAPLGIALFFIIRIYDASGLLADRMIETIPKVRSIDAFATIQDPGCFFASLCYTVNAIPPLLLKLYGPVVAITFGVFFLDSLFIFVRTRVWKSKAKNDKKYALKQEMTSFEASCLQRDMKSYFGQESDFYLSPEETGGDNWCVKEEYMVLSGFCLGRKGDFIVRNRDLIVFWLSELLSARAIKLLQINLSLTYWPVENGYVHLGRHYVIDGPLGTHKEPTSGCAPVNADEKQKH